MRLAARLLAALGLALGLGLVAPALPASAAACSGTGGVTVVVDPNGLGGDVTQGCVTGGSRNARALFDAAGAGLEYVRNEPGFVCRVKQKPGPEACRNVPGGGDYWSLWWTDGTNGWTYSQEGVNLLDVPDGGAVAFSWRNEKPTASAARTPVRGGGGGGQGGSGGGNGGGNGGSGGGGTGGGSGDAASPDASPSPDPTDEGAGSGDAGRTQDGARGGAAGGAKRPGTGDRSGKAGKPGKPGGKAGKNGDKNDRTGGRGADDQRAEQSESSPLTDADGETEQVSSASEEDPAGLPVWVPIAVIAALGLGGAGAVLQRRPTRGSA